MRRTEHTARWRDERRAATGRPNPVPEVFFVDSGTPFSASVAGRLIDGAMQDFARAAMDSVYLSESFKDAVRWHEDVEELPVALAAEPKARFNVTARVLAVRSGQLYAELFPPSDDFLDGDE